MAEPEELIIEGAHVATRVARDLWRRYGPPAPDSAVSLASVRGRLELFVTALLQTPISISALQPPAPVTWLSALARGPGRRRPEPAACGTDGERVLLAPSLDLHGSDDAALAIYRLLAVQQGVRIVRGTSRVAARISGEHARDWFAFAEAIAVDRWIAEHAGGLLPALERVRRDALARRTKAQPRIAAGDTLEELVRAFLAGDSARRPSAHETAEASLAWATAAAQQHPRNPRDQRMASVSYWGEVVEPSAIVASRWPGREPEEDASRDRQQKPRVAEMRRRPRVRDADDDEDDERPGPWMIRADEPQESVEDPFGLQRPADRQEDADPEGLADSLSDLREARVVRVPGQPKEVLQSGDPVKPAANAPPGSIAQRAGVRYPEWDYRAGRYRTPGAVVRERTPGIGDAEWVSAALARHARLVRSVRTRFERLRPRPIRLFRQVDGPEIDLQSYVTAAADRRAGVTPDGRVYVAVRPGRRELAVALLVDVSASTDAWVSPGRRIVDVEKEAMLLVCEALDALGDRYALFAFSGEGAEQVEVLPLKRFDEPAGLVTRRRIAALDSDRYTRLGAPIRHVTAMLARQRAASRLLLLLSDGKPNDVDVYEGRYGIEDTRQAVAEARRQGISVFCLTVDREAPGYARAIFGRTGFAVLRRPEQLPAVVVEVLRHLIRV
jgi:nitric oxide reductase NorD protein